MNDWTNNNKFTIQKISKINKMNKLREREREKENK